MSINQPRIKPGVPTGGQWAAFEHGEPSVSLGDAPTGGFAGPQGLAARIAELREEGYVAPVAVRAGEDPRSSSRRAQWWGTHFVTAEYGDDEGDYPQMPDDYTPRRTGGLALSGHRRTHRMAYRNADGSFALRMPSATSIKAYEKDSGGATFDVPVSAADSTGNSVAGWVRVTRSGNNWTATSLGDFGERSGIQVAEAVSSVLEARRPTMALAQAGDLLERHRERVERQGDEFVQVPSTFISGVGYSDEHGTMAVAIRDKLYGYRVPREAFENVATAHSPGAMYNRLVKGNQRTELNRCDKCGRFYGAGNSHTCASGHNERPGSTSLHNRAARSAAGSAFGGRQEPPHSPDPVPPEAPSPPPTGVHEQPPAGTKTINLRSELMSLGRGSMMTFGEPVPSGHRRGWTTDRGVSDTVARYTSSQYEPLAYDDSGDDGYVNGSNGLFNFSGLGGKDASTLLSALPRSEGDVSQNDGPTLASMLRSAGNHPGRIEVGGYLVGPDRVDERVSTDTVFMYDAQNSSPDDAWELCRSAYGMDGAAEPPSTASLVTNPWRPGEKCWRFWWD